MHGTDAFHSLPKGLEQTHRFRISTNAVGNTLGSQKRQMIDAVASENILVLTIDVNLACNDFGNSLIGRIFDKEDIGVLFRLNLLRSLCRGPHEDSDVALVFG
jgi:hypothetical protein